MPEDFDRCVAAKGSRVRTLKLKDGKYIHICYDKSGKSHRGEVKKAKKNG